jgi:hypothetical protein
MAVGQVDQIFVDWTYVYFGQCFQNCKSIANDWDTSFHSAGCVLLLIKHGLGNILGDIIAYSSYHPALGGHVSGEFLNEFSSLRENVHIVGA